MDNFDMTPAIVTALVAQQDPTIDDTVDIDITDYVDAGAGTSLDDDGNIATDDVGVPGILASDSVVTDNPLPDDVQQDTDTPIAGFDTDGWNPVDYSYDENGNFVVTTPVDDGLQPDFDSDDILTSSDF